MTYGLNKSIHKVINRAHGFPKDREGKEFVQFARWHHSRFHDPIIFRADTRRLVAAYRFYLKLKVTV